MYNAVKQTEYIQLSTYIQQFATLHVHVEGGNVAPHKPIMLLAIIRLISSGKILNNKILANDKLKDEFDALWQRHVLEDSTYKPAVWTPYWHLKNEPFWHFKPLTVGFNVDSLVAPGQTASIGKIQENIEYAYLDETLYNLLQSENNRYLLSRLLIETYLL